MGPERAKDEEEMLHRIRDIVVDQGGMLRTLTKAIQSPRRTLGASFEVVSTNWQRLLFGSERRYRELREELRHSRFLLGRQQELLEEFRKLESCRVRGRRVAPGHMRSLHAEMLYCLVRHYRPEVTVETGVCNGLSSAVILKAMAENGAGRLLSVDLPEFTDQEMNEDVFWEGKGGAAVPAKKRVGWLVEPPLDDRWTLSLGRSQDVLGPLLAEAAPIDIFIHDSEHSYENQMFEFTHGFAALRQGGVLVATDIGWSTAYADFWANIARTGAKAARVDAGCAVVLKG